MKAQHTSQVLLWRKCITQIVSFNIAGRTQVNYLIIQLNILEKKNKSMSKPLARKS